MQQCTKSSTTKKNFLKQRTAIYLVLSSEGWEVQEHGAASGEVLLLHCNMRSRASMPAQVSLPPFVKSLIPLLGLGT
jgi:hypothetical protein